MFSPKKITTYKSIFLYSNTPKTKNARGDSVKISQELLEEVGLYTDMEYEEEQDEKGVEEIIKDMLNEIEKLHDTIQSLTEENEEQYTSSDDTDDEFRYSNRL